MIWFQDKSSQHGQILQVIVNAFSKRETKVGQHKCSQIIIASHVICQVMYHLGQTPVDVITNDWVCHMKWLLANTRCLDGSKLIK